MPRSPREIAWKIPWKISWNISKRIIETFFMNNAKGISEQIAYGVLEEFVDRITNNRGGMFLANSVRLNFEDFERAKV